MGKQREISWFDIYIYYIVYKEIIFLINTFFVASAPESLIILIQLVRFNIGWIDIHLAKPSII